MRFILDGERIKGRMEETRQTTPQLAARAGIAIDTVRAALCQSERRYTERIVYGLAGALDLPLSEFARRG